MLVISRELWCFNSTMVRLKASHRQRQVCGRMFQFHYGTIKSYGLWFQIVIHSSFQFHYGTIKRRLRTRPVGHERGEFQFHYGTIKSARVGHYGRAGGSFNSTMVRLKGR